MTVIGELNDDGTVKTEADECALSGKIVLGEHHIVQRIPGTRFFYRYSSDYEHLLTPAKRAEIEAQVGVIPAEVKRKGKAAEENPT